MGQFSWLDCKTGEQVLDDTVRDVYVLIPQQWGGGHIKETCYDGYGHFGGHDIYDLVVDWNIPYIHEYIAEADKFHSGLSELKNMTIDEVDKMIEEDKRSVGIDLACYDVDNERLHFPIKITHDEYAVYEDCLPSKSDPNQGWDSSFFWDEEGEWF
jgi:hypothetical protein